MDSYEEERKPVAQSVIESSGELVRSTKYSENGTHAQDYVGIVQKRAGNITGMGIRYGKEGLIGTRVFDFEVYCNNDKKRLYSLLDYTKYTLLTFGDKKISFSLPDFVNSIHISLSDNIKDEYWTDCSPYKEQAILVRPDSYIQEVVPLGKVKFLIEKVFL